jgi:putative ABC transport system permease protein
VSTGMPMLGTYFGMPFQVAGQPVSDPSKRPNAAFAMVTPGYFQTIGLQVVRGRAFTDQDREGSVRVAVVNEALVKRHLAGRDPLGQRVLVEQLIPGVTRLGPPLEWEIVGVYRDVRNDGLRGGDDGGDYPEINVPFWQSPWPGAAVALRTAGDPDAARQGAAAVLRAVDPDLPMADVKTMDQIVDESLAGDRFQAVLFGGFAALALVLAAFGIYGVMSFAVAQRTHEIGLRMALGARRGQVLALVLREGASTALLGIALGSAGGYAIGRAMQGMWYKVGAFDPLAFGTVAVTLLATALLACLVPARRAASVEPMTALRQG